MSNKNGRQPSVDGIISKIEKLESQIERLESSISLKREGLKLLQKKLEKFMTPNNKPKLTAWLEARQAGLDKMSELLEEIPDEKSDPEFEDNTPDKSERSKKKRKKND